MYKFIHTARLYSPHTVFCTAPSLQIHTKQKPHSTDRLAIATIHAYLHVLGDSAVEYFQQHRHQRAALCLSHHVDSGFSGGHVLVWRAFFLHFNIQIWYIRTEGVCVSGFACFMCHCESHLMTIARAPLKQQHFTHFRTTRQCAVVCGTFIIQWPTYFCGERH